MWASFALLCQMSRLVLGVSLEMGLMTGNNLDGSGWQKVRKPEAWSGHFQMAASRVGQDSCCPCRPPLCQRFGMACRALLLSLGSAHLPDIIFPCLLCDTCCAPAGLSHWCPQHAMLSIPPACTHDFCSAPTTLLPESPADPLPAYLLPVSKISLKLYFLWKVFPEGPRPMPTPS